MNLINDNSQYIFVTPRVTTIRSENNLIFPVEAHSFIQSRAHAETVYPRPRRGAKFFALTSVISPPSPCNVIVSFLSLNTPVIIAWARRAAFRFLPFFNRTDCKEERRGRRTRERVNLSRRVSSRICSTRPKPRPRERDLISRIKNSNNSGRREGRSEFHAALRPRVSPGIRKSSAACCGHGLRNPMIQF